MSAGITKTLKWTEFFFNALVDPRALSRNIMAREVNPIPLSFSVPALVAIVDILSLSMLGRQSGFFYYKITYGWILFFLIIILRYVVAASLMDMISQFMGYEGRAGEIIPLLNYSLFPQTLLLPIVYIFKILNFAPIFFYLFFSFAFFLWSAFIAIQGISEINRTGFGKALVIYVFPYIFIGLISFFVLILLVITGTGFLTAI